MNEDVQLLRDLSDEIKKRQEENLSWKERKELIKKKALEHRSEITSEQLDKDIAEVEELSNKIKANEDDIAERTAKIAEVQARIAQNEKEKKPNMEKRIENKTNTLEYREAFKNYIQRGEVNKDVLEFRTDEHTSTSTASAVMPEVLINEIIKTAKISGNVLPKVRKTNLKGGVKYPTLSVRPRASWVTEGSVSDTEKLTTGSISFSYYELECRVAQSLLSEYASIEAFEAEFVRLVVETMVNAKEIAIFKGTGTNQPTGILVASDTKTTEIKKDELGKYDKLKAALAGLKGNYRVGAELFMAQETWDKIDGMVDTNGQPVAKVNYGTENGASYRLFGYPVNIVETDRIKDIDTAVAGTDYIMVLGNMNYYAINGNGNLGVYKFRDETKNVNVTKAYEILDGKPLVPEAFLKVKLKTGAAG